MAKLARLKTTERDLINEKRSATEIRKAALKNGDLRTLFRDGLEKVEKGITTFEEISRIVQVKAE